MEAFVTSESDFITLDVGGKLFKTSCATLITADGFFSRMLAQGSWRERAGPEPIFIDRDADAFPIVLSYLRSQRLCVDDTVDDSLLKKALVEADYYMLTGLKDLIDEELDLRLQRRQVSTAPDRELFKCVSASDLSGYLEAGWAFVAVYKADEVNVCNKNGRKVPATVRDLRCTACGDRTDLVKFNEHFVSIQPTMAVIKKKVPEQGLDSTLLRAVSDQMSLNFDASFG